MINLRKTPEIDITAFKIPTMLTINETAQKTSVSAHFIRQLAINNRIVHIRCGKKYLINLEKFIEYLNSGMGETVKEACCSEIKAVKV